MAESSESDTPAALQAPLGPGTWLSWIGAAFLSLLSILPLVVQRALAHTLAFAYVRGFGKNGRHVRTVHINLRACFPEQDEVARAKLVQRYFFTLVMVVMHIPKQWWRGEDYFRSHRICSGMEAVNAARADDVPCVFLISHTVALDIGMISLSVDYPFTGFYKPFKNPVVDWLVRRSRLRFGGKPFARGDGFRSIIRNLKDMDILCYLCDEDYGVDASVFAPFFNHQKATLKMLPKIVRLTKASVFPMATYFDTQTGKFEIRIQPALTHYPNGDDLIDATTINAAIEHSVRHAPEQYLWKLQLFRSCPKGGDSRYLQVARGELQPENM